MTSGGALTRLRSSGAATPAATIPQAVALIAFDSRTGREYMAVPGGSGSGRPGTDVCSPRGGLRGACTRAEPAFGTA